MKPPPILLDTCAAIWSTQTQGLSNEGEKVLAQADAERVPVFVSPITAWEVGQLVSRSRLVLAENPKTWFAALLEAGVQLAELTPEVLIEASFLPSCALRDPADRIITATARAYGYRILTRDRPILEYGSQGWVRAVSC